MAEIFYLMDTRLGAAGVNEHLTTQQNGTAPTDAYFGTPTGWNPGTNAAGQSAIMDSLAETQRGSADWSATLQPSGAMNAAKGDAFRTPSAFNGTFANANWTISAALRANTSGYAGRFRLRWRVYKSQNTDGASATELTAAVQVTPATTANLVNTANSTLSVTWSPGSEIVLANEYLFFQLGIEITLAGNTTTQDVQLRKNAASAITTPNFTSGFTYTGSVALSGGGTLAADGTVSAGWGAPENLQASAISTTEIDLSWDAVPGASGYDVERDGIVIATDVMPTTYQDTGLTPSTSYTYRVRAVA